MTELATIADAADSLTNPVRVREPIPYWDANRNRKIRYHEHTLPSLLDRLGAAVTPGEVYVEDDGGHVHRTPRSTPPARLEAINAAMQIEAGAAMWCIRLGLNLREDAVGNIRQLVGANLNSDQAADLLRDLRHWYGWAATLTGWRRPPWTPQAPCPFCGDRSLRVRLDTKTAACVSCREAWTEDTIGLLAEHLRALEAVPTDTRQLRTWAVLNRRLDEQRREQLAATPRPDLPYLT